MDFLKPLPKSTPVGNMEKIQNKHAKIFLEETKAALQLYVEQEITPVELFQKIGEEGQIYAKRVNRPWDEFFDELEDSTSEDYDQSSIEEESE